MKKVILVHGYNGIPPIYNWLEKELTSKGYKVIIPEFPTQEGVMYSKWKKIMDSYKQEINPNTIFITHSIGNEFLIKYLYENNININLCIGLAGFAREFKCENRDDLNRTLKEFLVSNEEKEKFKELVQIKYSIYSDNDHIVPFNILEEYAKDVNAIPIFIKGIGHMGNKSGLDSIPEVLEIIERNENCGQ